MATIDFLTKEQAAEKFHVHKNTLTNWERQGKITASRIGRRWYITEPQIQRALGVSDDKGTSE